MCKLKIIIILCLLPAIAWATPNTTSTSGTFSHKASVTIGGTGFGTKSPAAPYKYDNFESGTPGANLSGGWFTYTQTGGYLPIYSTANTRYSGTQSAHQRFSGCGTYACNTCYIGLTGLSTQVLYVSGWFNYQTDIPSNGYRNLKLMTAYVGSEGTGDWETRCGGTDASAGDMYAYGTCGQGTPITHDYFSLATAMQDNTSWHRMESTVFLQSGTDYRDYNIDLAQVAYISGNFTDGSCPMTYLLLWHYIDSDASTNETTNRYIDELYVDITRARIEIGNASTWAACTHREIQIPSAWSDTSATFTVNAGTFTSGQVAYVYVVDSANDPDPSGYPITIGETSSDTTAPTVSNYSPAKSATDVPIDTDISATISDSGSGVNINGTYVYIEGASHCCSSMTGTCVGAGTKDLVCTGDVSAVTFTKTGNTFSNSQTVDMGIYSVDLDGNTMTGDLYSFTTTAGGEDTTDPVVAITSPTTIAYYYTTDSATTFSGTASDNVALSSVAWSNSQGGSGTASGTTTWSVDVLPLTESTFAANGITNGTFDSDYSGYTANAAILDQGEYGGRANVLSVANDGAWSEAYVTLSDLENGALYLIEAKAYSVGVDSAENGSILVDFAASRTDTWGDAQITGITTANTWTDIAGLVQLVGTSMTIRLHSEDVNTAYFDNISVRKVTAANVITVTATDSSANTGTDTLSIVYNPLEAAPSAPQRLIIQSVDGAELVYEEDGFNITQE